jgi:hypothetical protein
MIAVKLQGRLGNQLFQYAFIYAAAKRQNTSFYLDKTIYDFILPKYFEVKTDFVAPLDNTLFSIRGYKGFFCIRLKLKFYRLLHKRLLSRKEIILSNYEAVPDNLKLIRDKALYEGFFQSVDYFKEIEVEIRKLYSIKRPWIAAFEKIQKQINLPGKRVVVHVRRTDYLDLDWSLPLSYYKKAIEEAGTTGIHVIFISDDPAFVKKEFAYVTNKYVSTHDEITDLQFLMSADICILSNSSFSWWGAWLNGKSSKKIIAPKFWLGYNKEKEYPVGITQPGWTLL